MRYSYFCTVCGNEDIDETFSYVGDIGPHPCSVCGSIMRRGFSFSFRRSMQEHFNTSTGTYVSTRRDFEDDLKRKSEEASHRTGMDHNFVPVDMNDMKALGVTDEGLEETHRKHHDNALQI